MKSFGDEKALCQCCGGSGSGSSICTPCGQMASKNRLKSLKKMPFKQHQDILEPDIITPQRPRKPVGPVVERVEF